MESKCETLDENGDICKGPTIEASAYLEWGDPCDWDSIHSGSMLDNLFTFWESMTIVMRWHERI